MSVGSSTKRLNLCFETAVVLEAVVIKIWFELAIRVIHKCINVRTRTMFRRDQNTAQTHSTYETFSLCGLSFCTRS